MMAVYLGDVHSQFDRIGFVEHHKTRQKLVIDSSSLLHSYQLLHLCLPKSQVQHRSWLVNYYALLTTGENSGNHTSV